MCINCLFFLTQGEYIMPSFIIDMPGKKPVDITKEINNCAHEKDIKDVLKKTFKGTIGTEEVKDVQSD
tara:strand:- start:1733 stop:1936 length:204 start_codon:yes stop_codon:yes gene_type:complete